jgi:hypothetical protein
LFELEQRRAAALRQAAQAAAQGDGVMVQLHARTALRLRPGTDALHWLATGYVLRREFARALACWREANAAPPSLAG